MGQIKLEPQLDSPSLSVQDEIQKKIEQFQVLEDKNLYQSNFKHFTVIFTFS